MINLDPLADFRRQMSALRAGPFSNPQDFGTQPDSLQLTPEEQEALLSRVASGPGSGLQYIGETLDKPGRALRGLLAGEPYELLNLFPFSDTLGITNPDDSIDGRELLTKWGLTKPNDPNKWELADFGGFAAEVLLDPLLPFTAGVKGATTASGKLLQRAGLFDDALKVAGKGPRVAKMTTTLADVAANPGTREALEHAATGMGRNLDELIASNEPLGGVASYFGHQFTGPTAEKLATKMDEVGSAIRWSAPVRHAAAAFDNDLMGFTPKELQIAAKEASVAARKSKAMDRELLVTIAKDFDEAGLMNMDDGRLLRQVVEGTAQVPADPKYAVMAKHAPKIRQFFDDRRVYAKSIGRQVEELDDDIGYLTRQMFRFPLDKSPHGKRMRAAPVETGMQTAREDIYRRLPEGTESINKMSIDPEISGPSRLAKNNETAAAIIRQKYMGIDDVQWRADKAALEQAVAEKAAILEADKVLGDQNRILQSNIDLTQAQKALDEHNFKWEQSEGLADAMANLTEQHVQTGIPLFGNHPLEDMSRYIEADNVANTNTLAMYDALKRTAVKLDPKPSKTSIRQPGPTTRLDKALERIGLEPTAAAKQMEQRGIKAIDYAVPNEVLDEIVRVADQFRTPESVGWFLDNFVDKPLNLFKRWVLTAPGRYVRDFYSGQFANFLLGGWSWPTVKAAGDVIHNGAQVFAGASEIPLFKGMTDEAASRAFIIEAAKHGVINGGMINDLAGSGQKLLDQIPGQRPNTLWDVAKTMFPKKPTKAGDPTIWQQLNPLNSAGVATHETVNSVAKAGDKAGAITDGMNRLAPFMEYLKQGMAPDVAAMRVKAAQVDYNNLTKFERKVMKRLVPFYTFSRGMAPTILGELMDKPGGRLAQVIRGTNSLRSQGGFVPDHVGQGLAIPIGQEEDGTQRYLSSIDLPHESILNLLQPGFGLLDTMTNTGQGLLGNLNPYLKGPLEVFAGKQFFSGRDLSELDSRIGRVAQSITGSESPPDVPILLDQLLSNSPLARVGTTLGTAVDPRKGYAVKAANLLTGARFSDVDMDKAKFYAGRDVLGKLLADAPGARRFESITIPQERRAELSPEHQQMYELYKGIQKQSKQRARELKKEKSLAGG